MSTEIERDPDGRCEVRVLKDPAACAEAALFELRHILKAHRLPLVSFAMGQTFTPFFGMLKEEMESGRINPESFIATHLDEFLGFTHDRPGGMVHEVLQACPPLKEMFRRGTFLPMPANGLADSLVGHGERLIRAGGVVLQFAGIGRNGHIAFNEPGTPFEQHFHRTVLAAMTRSDARPRFAGDDVPEHAVTAGLADIAVARRLVVVATGAAKATAVKAMVEGPVGPQCPASIVRHHESAVVLLDPEAAQELASR